MREEVKLALDEMPEHEVEHVRDFIALRATVAAEPEARTNEQRSFSELLMIVLDSATRLIAEQLTGEEEAKAEDDAP